MVSKTLDNKCTLCPKKPKQAKGCLTFKVLKKLTNGYRTIKTIEGATYDYVGVNIPTDNGSHVTLALEALPDGWFNFYVISSNYEIALKDSCHRTIGEFVKIKKGEQS